MNIKMITYKLGDLCDLVNGYAFKSKDYVEESNTLICRMSNIRPGGYFDINYSRKFVPDNFKELYRDYILKDGDLIIAMTDLANDPKILGVPTIVNTEGYELLLNQRVGKLVIKSIDIVNPKYLSYILTHSSYKEYYKKFAAGGLQINISKKDILNILVPIPELEIQNKIVAIVDKLNILIDKRQSQITALDELTQSVFLEMFGEPIANPKKFELVNLGNLGDWKSGGTPSRANNKYYMGNIPWLSSGELNELFTYKSIEHITEEAINNSAVKLIEEDSLLLGMYDTAALKSTINRVKCTCNQAIAFAKIEEKKASTIYIYFYIQFAKDHLKRQQRGVRQKNLNLSMIKDLSVVLPPIDKQYEFEKKAIVLYEEKQSLIEALKQFGNLYNSILQRAFKGELFQEQS